MPNDLTLFPEFDQPMARPVRSFVFEMSPDQLFEAQTGLDPQIFVEAVVLRLGLQVHSDADVEAFVRPLADRLVLHFVEHPEFAAAALKEEDPRVPLQKLVRTWAIDTGRCGRTARDGN